MRNPILIKPNSKTDYLEIQEWLPKNPYLFNPNSGSVYYRIQEWLNEYGHTKEQFICTEHNTNLNLNGKIIRTSDSLKILGVTIDNNINFNEHINNVCDKASQRVGVIMRLRNLIPTTAKLVLLKSAILPYLTYCYLVWHFCRASDTQRLERIQERELRAVYKDTKSSYHQLLNRANLPTLLNGRLQDMCTNVQG